MKGITDYIKDYLLHCRKERRLSPHSLKAYLIDLEQFEEYIIANFGIDVEMSHIDRDIIKKYIGKLNEKYAIKTVKRKMASIRGFFEYLEDEKAIELSPFVRLHVKIRETQTLPAVLTLNEVQKILSAAYSDPDSLSEFLYYRDILVLEMLFASGARVNELCNMKLRDMNHAESTIKILGKGRKERFVFFGNPELLEVLNNYRRCAKQMGFRSVYLFLNKNGKQLSTQAVRDIVSKYRNLAGIKKNITPHTFRHTFASLLLEEGVDLKFIQEFLGHSSITTTQIYVHVNEQKALRILQNKHPRQKINNKL